METNECIICFEEMDNQCNVNLFECIHKENMHPRCVYTLVMCPICRAPRKNQVYVHVIVVQMKRLHMFWLSLCLFIYIILSMSIIDSYEKVKEHILASNETYPVDHI